MRKPSTDYCLLCTYCMLIWYILSHTSIVEVSLVCERSSLSILSILLLRVWTLNKGPLMAS